MRKPLRMLPVISILAFVLAVTTSVSAAANFEIENPAISPNPAKEGDIITISCVVKNTGGVKGTYTLELKINDTVTNTQEVTLAPGASQSVGLGVRAGPPGDYVVQLGDWSDIFTVTTSSGTPSSSTPPSASLPISGYVELTRYNPTEKLSIPEWASVTKGCCHASASLSLTNGQNLIITLKSDCPIAWDVLPRSEKPGKAEICAVFALMTSCTEVNGERVWIALYPGAKQVKEVSISNEGKWITSTLSPSDTGIYKLILLNHDPLDSHYCEYDIALQTSAPVPLPPPSAPPQVPGKAILELPTDSPTSAVRVTATAPYLSFLMPKLKPKGIITTVQPTSKALGLPFQNPSWEPRELRNKILELAQEYAEKNPYSSKNDCKKMSVALWRIFKSNNIEADIAVGNLDTWGESRFAGNHAWLIVFDREATPIAVEATGGYIVDPEELATYKELCIDAFNNGLSSGDWASFYEWRKVYDAKFWDCQQYLEARLFSEPVGFLLGAIFLFIP